MHCAYSLKIIESAFHRAAVAMSHSIYQESIHTETHRRTQRSKTCTKERETHSHIMPVIIIYNSLHIECCLKWRLISSNILSFTYLCRVLFRRLVFFCSSSSSIQICSPLVGGPLKFRRQTKESEPFVASNRFFSVCIFFLCHHNNAWQCLCFHSHNKNELR